MPAPPGIPGNMAQVTYNIDNFNSYDYALLYVATSPPPSVLSLTFNWTVDGQASAQSSTLVSSGNPLLIPGFPGYLGYPFLMINDGVPISGQVFNMYV